jgi:hypothetical protein
MGAEATDGFVITIFQVVFGEFHEEMNAEYLVNVGRYGSSWEVRRKYQSFFSLQDSLATEFPQLTLPRLPDMSNASSSIFAKSKPLVVEERKKKFEEYLNDLAGIPVVRECL